MLFDCERLTLARRLRGMRKNQLAQAVGTTPKAIGRYEAGVQTPEPPTLRRLAIALGVPVEFFQAGRSPVSLDGAHFRSLRSTSQIERDQALAYGRIATDVVAVLETLVDFPEVDLPEYPVPPDEIAGNGPVEAARLARKALLDVSGPVPHVVRLLESHGVLVLVLPEAAERVDAFSVGVHPRPMVFFNPAKGDYWRNRFDAAHELGHLVMHADAEPGEKIVEDQAHRSRRNSSCGGRHRGRIAGASRLGTARAAENDVGRQHGGAAVPGADPRRHDGDRVPRRDERAELTGLAPSRARTGETPGTADDADEGDRDRRGGRDRPRRTRRARPRDPGRFGRAHPGKVTQHPRIGTVL